MDASSVNPLQYWMCSWGRIDYRRCSCIPRHPISSIADKGMSLGSAYRLVGMAYSSFRAKDAHDHILNERIEWW